MLVGTQGRAHHWTQLPPELPQAVYLPAWCQSPMGGQLCPDHKLAPSFSACCALKVISRSPRLGVCSLSVPVPIFTHPQDLTPGKPALHTWLQRPSLVCREALSYLHGQHGAERGGGETVGEDDPMGPWEML